MILIQDIHERYFPARPINVNDFNDFAKPQFPYNIQAENYQFIAATVNNFSKKNLIYRLWQAIKHIFGQSDWDRAVKLLSAQMEQSTWGTKLKGDYQLIYGKKNTKEAVCFFEKIILQRNRLWKTNIQRSAKLLLLHLSEPTNTKYQIESLDSFERKPCAIPLL